MLLFFIVLGKKNHHYQTTNFGRILQILGVIKQYIIYVRK